MYLKSSSACQKCFSKENSKTVESFKNFDSIFGIGKQRQTKRFSTGLHPQKSAGP